MEMELLQAAREGDRNAFEPIVAQYQAAVCAITFSGTGRVDVSEELAQEAFVNAWQHLRLLRDLRDFRAWLYSIARHTVHNYHRRRPPASLDACPEEANIDDTQNPPEILMRREERILLEQAILRLPAKYREPLVMFHRQQRSIRESAEALGLSEATFRTRLHRARNLLRKDIAARVEHALGWTGPRKEFTRAVMVAIGGIPAALSVPADAAVSGLRTQTAAPGAISAVFGSLGVKIAVVTAVIAAGALFYTHSNSATPPARREASSPSALQEPIETRPEASRKNSGRPAAAQAIGRGEDSQDERQPVPQATDAKKTADQPEQTTPETIVTGTVIDKNTLIPLPGARVGFRQTEAVVTDADGRFHLSYRESQDEALLYALAPGYAVERIALRMNIGEHQEVSLRVAPGLMLASVVVDPNQNPMPNARLYAVWACLASAEVSSDVQGRFKMDGLPPDAADLLMEVECVGYRSEALFMPSEGARLGEDVFREIVLTPEPPRAVLVGRVTDAGSKPIAGATVGCYGSLIETQTDQEGRYALQDLNADLFVLYVSHPQYPLFVQDVALPAAQEEATLNVQFAKPRRLSGRVIDEQGQPVAEGEDLLVGVEVQLKAIDKDQRSHDGRTDASGQFKFLHVPPGRYVFAALRPRDQEDGHARDPDDLSHVLYEVMDVQSDLDLTVDYRTRSINR